MLSPASHPIAARQEMRFPNRSNLSTTTPFQTKHLNIPNRFEQQV